MALNSPSPRLAGLLLLTVTIFGWGLNWPAIKVLLREWPPLFSRGIAGVTAAGLLALLALARGEKLGVPLRTLPLLGVAAFVNVFAWMGFGTMVMQYLTIGEGALLAYTMPIWTAIFAWPALGERPTLRSFLAILLGASGLAILFSGQTITFGDGKALGIAMALSCAILFALGAVLMKSQPPLAPLPLTVWQVGLGCAPMVIIGLLFEQPRIDALTWRGGLVMIYMTLVPMAACYLCWFGALRRLPASTATMATIAVPVIGVVSGALTVGEPLGAREAAAIVITLSGVALALRRARPDPAATRA